MKLYSQAERENWERLFREKVASLDLGNDPAHDVAHFVRVVNIAKKLCLEEDASWEVVVPAAWLHDYVNLPKDDHRRAEASRFSAAAAIDFLTSAGYAEEYYPKIKNSIEAHSFSAQIECASLEAKIVQDADRLDALGAIGIARLFCVSGLLKRPFYNLDEPFAKNRKLDDRSFSIDHFFVKLFKVSETLKTEAGRAEGVKRVAFMKEFLKQFGYEIA